MSWTAEVLLSEIKKRPTVIIELGCGPNPSNEVIGIDALELEGVHYIANLEEGLKIIPDNSVDEIRSRHFLEHIENFSLMMSEIHRVLKPGGKHVAIVPHFANPYYYSDYTHKRFFGLYTFDYFSRTENQLRRKVPDFYGGPKFKVTKRKIVFKSPDFFFRNQFKKRVLTPLFNFNTYMQELYEGSFCFDFPPHEVQFEMVPEK
jgi:ubiquinone/menaquinone biosynthesis C-methylase UbiE